MFLEDPSKGYVAKVTEDGKVSVIAESYDLIHSISHSNAQAYVLSHVAVAPSLTVTATGGYILLLTNNSGTDLILTKMGLTFGASGQSITIVRNPILGTLANNTEVTPANLNFSSANPAECTAYAWNETGDGITGVTGGTEMCALYAPGAGFSQLDLAAAYILGRESTIGFKGKGAGEMALAVHFCFHTHISEQ